MLTYQLPQTKYCRKLKNESLTLSWVCMTEGSMVFGAG